MLTVITPAATRRLTTPEAVVEAVGGGMTAELAGRYVDRASSAIVTYLRRVLARERVRESLMGQSRRGPLILSRAPVVEIHSISHGGTVLDAEGWELDAESGMVERVSGAGFVAWGARAASVEYTAGFLLPGDVGRDLPEEIEQAAIIVAAGFWHARDRDPALRSESAEGIGTLTYYQQVTGGAGIPGEAAGLLEPFRRAGGPS